MIRRVSRDGVVRRGQSYGEWAEPADVKPNDWKDMVLPHPEVSTAYTVTVPANCTATVTIDGVQQTLSAGTHRLS